MKACMYLLVTMVVAMAMWKNVEASVHDCYNELIKERKLAESEPNGELKNTYVCADEVHYLECTERELEKLPPSDYKDSTLQIVNENRKKLQEHCSPPLQM